jgi:hypothetical protein
MGPVVYREEVLTIMACWATFVWSSSGSTARSEETMARKRKKRTPEEIAQEREWRAQSDANLRRLRELVDRGWADLEERRRRESAASS